MNRSVSYYRSALAWLAMGLAVAALVIYDYSLRARQQELCDRTVDIRMNLERLGTRIENEKDVHFAALVHYNGVRYTDQEVRRMLRECRSREDFLVREGPRIAWSELRSSTETVKRIGLYLPRGRHRLKVAWLDDRQRHLPGPLLPGDTAEIEGALSCDLGVSSEVYEIVFQAGEQGGLLWLKVIGWDNQPIYEDIVRGLEGPCQLRTQVTQRALQYPSELNLNDVPHPYFRECKPLPVTDLGFISVKERRTGQSTNVRLWVESDAPACMSALSVAINYDKVTSLSYRRDYPMGLVDALGREREFDRLFQPYDGSGRFYFREGIFADSTFE